MHAKNAERKQYVEHNLEILLLLLFSSTFIIYLSSGFNLFPGKK